MILQDAVLRRGVGIIVRNAIKSRKIMKLSPDIPLNAEVQYEYGTDVFDSGKRDEKILSH